MVINTVGSLSVGDVMSLAYAHENAMSSWWDANRASGNLWAPPTGSLAVSLVKSATFF